MTDEFGRVLLFDVATSTICRIWKGYRDAQCGWVVSSEEAADDDDTGAADMDDGGKEDPVTLRKCTFLVILAPKRQLLEIWTAALGTRVAAFNVGPNCKLISLSHNSGAVARSGGLSAYCYILSGDGKFKTVHVPFESALSHSLSSSTQDRHQLRRLRSLFTSISEAASAGNLAPDAIAELKGRILEGIGNINAPASLNEALSVVSAERLPAEVLMDVQDAFDTRLATVAKNEKETAADPQFHLLAELLQSRRAQIQAHVAINAACPSSLSHASREGLPSDASQLVFGLATASLVPDDENRLGGLFRHCLSAHNCRNDTNWPEPTPMRLPLGAFLNFLHLKSTQKANSEGHSAVHISDNDMARMAFFCFQSTLTPAFDVAAVKTAWHSLGLGLYDLLELLLHLCFTLPLWLVLKPPVMENILASMGAILSLKVPTADEEASPPHTLAAFFRVICARNVAAAHALVLTILGSRVAQHADRAAFATCVGQLEDTLCLRLVQGLDIFCDGAANGTHAPRTGPNILTLARLVEGRSVHTQLIKALLSCGTRPSHLGPATTVQAIDYSSCKFNTNPEQSLILLRSRFPAATAPPILALRCAAEFARISDKQEV